jgi:hypothetical protein
MLHDVTTRDVG